MTRRGPGGDWAGTRRGIIQGVWAPPKLLAKAKSDENERTKAEGSGSNTPWAYRPGEFISIAMYAYSFVAVSHWHDRKEISNGELPRLFAECCIRGPGGHAGPAHEGPGPTSHVKHVSVWSPFICIHRYISLPVKVTSFSEGRATPGPRGSSGPVRASALHICR